MYHLLLPDCAAEVCGPSSTPRPTEIEAIAGYCQEGGLLQRRRTLFMKLSPQNNQWSGMCDDREDVRRTNGGADDGLWVEKNRQICTFEGEF